MIEDIDFIKQEALEEKYFVSVFTRTMGNINFKMLVQISDTLPGPKYKIKQQNKNNNKRSHK